MIPKTHSQNQLSSVGKNYFKVFVFLISISGFSQVGINTTNPQASLDINASNISNPSNEDGLLIPRIAAFPASNPTAAQEGMMVYLTTLSAGKLPGFYYWDPNAGPAAWISIKGTEIEKINDLSDGKSDNDGSQNGSSLFLGANAGSVDDSSDNQNVGIGFESLMSNTTGFGNAAIGYDALKNNAVGNYNTAIGNNALATNNGVRNSAIGFNALSSNTTGGENLAVGYEALLTNSTGNNNTAIGSQALYSNTIGLKNTAIGSRVLYSNTIGTQNVALGYHSLYSNIDGDNNIALGYNALYANNTGSNNIANGYTALRNNTTGTDNIAFGYNTLFTNTIGYNNIAIGRTSLNKNLTGRDNTALGASSLANNISGNNNVAVGRGSLYTNTTGGYNIAIGDSSLYLNTDGAWNIAMGLSALHTNTSGSRNIALGNYALGSNNTGVYNISLGEGSLGNNNNGGYNIGMGNDALDRNISGGQNIALGTVSLNRNTDGDYNVAFGYAAMYSNLIGNHNIGIGEYALSSSTGNHNVAIGRQAGRIGASGSSNVYIGSYAGYNHAGSNTLWIENSSANADNALIYGEFDTNILRTNSEFQIGNPASGGYSFPTADGAANQVLQTTGAGTISWSTLPITSVSGTTNYIPKFTGANALGNSSVYDTGTNVGVGTITPGYKLSVNGQSNLNEGIASGVALRVNGAEALWFNGTNFSWGYGGTSNYFADTVGIGENNPSFKLEVKTAENSTYVAHINNTSTGTGADGLKITVGASTPTVNNYFVGMFGGTTLKGRISGNTALTGVNYYTTSDARLKNNISSISNALALIDLINPRVYEYKANPGTKEYGFIAQELQPLYPQAVAGSPTSDIETDPMMVDYSRLTPLLTAGVKELKKQVDLLSEENKKLKKQLRQYELFEARLSLLENNFSKDEKKNLNINSEK